MPNYKRMHEWGDLPTKPPKEARETLELDLKGPHKKDPAEQAKDVAAFANAHGGVILIGVAETADNYERTLLSLTDAKLVAKDYEDAARDLLAPRPLVDPVVVLFPGDPEKALVAVNVDPFPGQLIGARLPGTEGWRFPVRAATRHTQYLDPEKAMIYANAKTRKASILLGALPEKSKLLVYVRCLKHRGTEVKESDEYFEGELGAVDAPSNTVEVWVTLRAGQRVVITAPLEDVETVWKSRPYWAVRFSGVIRDRYKAGEGQSIMYVPG